MIFTPQQIAEILGIIDRYTFTFIAHHVSPKVLSDADKAVLSRSGIDIANIPGDQSNITQAFKFGLLSKTLQDSTVRAMSYDSFKKHLLAGKMFKLNALETAALDNLHFQTFRDITKLTTKIKDGITDSLVHADKKNHTVKHSKLVTDAAKRAIENRKDVTSVISDIGRKTQIWNRDLGRIADYVMHTAFDEGRAHAIMKQDGDNALVYKDVYPGACPHCLKAYLRGGAGSEPRIYTIAQLKSNSTNVGRKVAELKPVIGPHHPWCYDKETEVLTNEGWKFFKDLHHKEKFFSMNLDTGEGEWVASVNKVDQHYKGPMYHFQGKSFDLMTTPNHMHVIRTQKAKKLRLVDTKDLSKESQFLKHIPKWVGSDSDIIFDEHKYDVGDFNELFGWYLAEGSVIKHVNNRIHLAQIKYIDELYQLTKKVFNHRRVSLCKGYVEIGLLKSDTELIDFLKKLGHSNTKFIPNQFKNQSTQNLKRILYGFHKGDGSIEGGRLWEGYQCKETRIFHTSSKKMSDDIGELLLKTGKSPAYTYSEPKSIFDKKRNKSYTQNQGMWLIRENKSKFSGKKNMKVDIVNYDDRIYDVELERNHTLVVRRKGKVSVSGNCRCTIMSVPSGFTLTDYNNSVWLWNGQDFVRDPSKFVRKVQRRSKIEVTVNDKTTEI